MIAEHELVVLTTDFAKHGLEAGDVGAVVHVYPGGEAYEVEFASGAGLTVAVVTVEADSVRSVAAGEILHVRAMPA